MYELIFQNHKLDIKITIPEHLSDIRILQNELRRFLLATGWEQDIDKILVSKRR